MNIKNRKSSFSFKTTLTIVLFGISIILCLYIFQNLYLNYYYEIYKIDQVKEIASKLDYEIDDLNNFFKKTIAENDVCIEYVSSVGSLLYNQDMKGCILKNPSVKIQILMDKMIESDEETNFYTITNPIYKTKTFLFGRQIGENYVFINSELESLDMTNKALRKQVMYLLVIVIIVSIVIAYFVSHTITKPIFEITKKAKKMGNGDLSVVFEPSNISEIDELSETLNYAKNEMVKTDDYRRDLMANVGHDLKTPLTLIKSYAEMIRDITYKDDIKRNDNLNVIINETDRLNDLVNDIIELSKLESNCQTLNIEEYDLIKSIKDIISKFEILEITENYNFIYEGLESAMIKADKKKMNQVIYNLLGNAVNYTGKDLKIFIKVSKVKAGFKVEIKDTGKGIDSETIKHVWDRYYKTEKKHKRNKIGTGLGLSIVREILEAHEFKYGVNSKVGEYTSFYFIVKK